MAITINTRPRTLYYYTAGSPAIGVYSTWNAAWNPLVYIFNVTTPDVLSRVKFKIFEYGSNTQLAEFTLRPFKAGLWNVDMATYLKSYLYSQYTADFTTYDNSIDQGNSLTFYITYQQIFDTGETSAFNSEQTRPIVAMCAAKQFGDQDGANMGQYTSFNFDLPEEKKMKFLTAFERPVMFKGYPLNLSFIYSLDLMGVQIKKREQERNVNGVEILTSDTDLNPFGIGKVNYLKVSEPVNQYTNTVKVSLRAGNAIESVYVDEGYVDDGYTQII